MLKNIKKSEARRKDFKLPSIIPIVLYNGAGKWTVCRSFREMLDGNELFLNHVLDFNYILFDVNRYSEEELLGLTNLISGVFLLDQKIDSEELKERLIKLVGIFRGLKEEELSLFKSWFKWIVKPRISEELQPKIDEVLEKSKMLEVENMVYNLANTIDEMKKKAEVTGIEKGKIEVAKSALEKGADVDFVIKITGLDEDVVKKLKEEI